MKKRINRVLFWFLLEMISACVCVSLLLLNDNGDYNDIVALLLLFINLLSLIKARNNWYLFIVFSIITYSNYSICVSNYLASPINTFFASYAYTIVGAKGVNILLGFSVLLLVCLPDTVISKQREIEIIKNNRHNVIVVLGVSLVLVLIWIFGYKRPETVGDRGSPTALYEYSLIFLIISFYYSGRDKRLYGLTLLLAGMYAIQNFVFGGRITGVQIVVVIVLCLFGDKLSIKKVIPVSALFFVIMSGIGLYRASILQYGMDIRVILQTIVSRHFALDTAYSSYYTSMTFLDVLARTSLKNRLYLFFQWVLSMLIGGSVPDSNLAYYTRQFFLHYNGGVLPYFAWFYLGFIGVLLLSIYIRFLFGRISQVNVESSGLIRCIAIYVCASTFRWYLYSPAQLFRGILLLCFVYVFADLVDRITNKSISS